MKNVKGNIIALIAIILSFSGTINAQKQTLDNVFGFWQDNAIWKNGQSPGTNRIYGDVTVFGRVISEQDISLKYGRLNVIDTLTIKGDLNLDNFNQLVIRPDAILLISGDLYVKSKVWVSVQGTLIVDGDVNAYGFRSTINFTDQAKMFVTGRVNKFSRHTLPSLNCNPENYPEYCRYGGLSQLKQDPVFSFYQSGGDFIKAKGATDFCSGEDVLLTTYSVDYKRGNGVDPGVSFNRKHNNNKQYSESYKGYGGSKYNTYSGVGYWVSGGDSEYGFAGLCKVKKGGVSLKNYSNNSYSGSGLFHGNVSGKQKSNVWSNGHGYERAIKLKHKGQSSVFFTWSSQGCTKYDLYSFYQKNKHTLLKTVNEFQWYRNGTPLGGETADSLVVKESGDYHLMITARTYVFYPWFNVMYELKTSSYILEPMEVRVHDLPEVDLGENVDGCYGENIALDAGSGFTSYLWSNGETGSDIAISEVSNSDYYVSVTDSNNCSNSSDTINVTINALPEINLGENIKTCYSDSVALEAGSGFTSYLWSNGETGPDIAISEVSNSDYYVSVTDSNNCSNSSDTINVTINALPEINLGENIKTCYGDSVALEAGSGFISYIWSNGETGSDIAISEVSNSDYYVSVTDSNNCSNSSDTVNVTINALPEINLGENIKTCYGDSVALDAGSGFTSYIWSNGETGSNIVISEVSNSDYYVSVADSNNCRNSSDTVNIIINALPDVDLGGDKSVCSGETVTLDAGAGHTSYEWSTGDMGQTIEISEEGSLEYWVEVTDEKGCKGRSEAVEVRVDPLPVVSLGENKSVCSGETVTLDAGAGHTSYEWSTGDMGQTIEISEEGSLEYWVEVTDEKGCKGRSEAVEVRVDPLPVVSLGENKSVCSGETVTLDAGAGHTSYEWSTGDMGQTIEISEEGSLEYWVEVTDEKGCKGRSEAVEVRVDPLPVVSLGENKSVCSGETVTLDAGAGHTSYEWSTGDMGQTIEISEEGSLEYWVEVTDEKGCKNRSEAVEVRVDPLPVVSLGENKSVCSGETVTLDAGAGHTSYEWSTGDMGQTIEISEEGSLEYWVEVTDEKGCKNRSEAVEVRVDPLPVVSLGENKSVCSGETVTLDAGAGHTSYEWSTGDMGQTIEISEEGSLEYWVEVTDEKGCKGRSEAVEVRVDPLPVVSLGENKSVCSGETVTLDAGAGHTSYEWSTGDMGQTIEISEEGSLEYWVEVTDEKGCKNRSEAVEVRVDPLPVVSLGENKSVCSGETVTLDAGAGHTSYEWSTGDMGQTIEISEEGSLEYWVEVTDEKGCKNRSEAVEVRVDPLPVVSLGENKSVCSGETVTLDAGAGHTSYEWSTGDMGQTIEISEEGSLEYWVEVTDEKGCKGRSEAVEVRVDPLPVVSLGENKSVCSGETVTLDAGAGHTSYEWSTGDMGQTIEISEEGSLEYWVEVTDEKGCKGRSEAVEVRVDPLPVVSLGENKSVCSGETVTLDAGAGHTSYEWSTGDMGQTIEISEEGSLEYWVEVTDEKGCKNRSEAVEVRVDPLPVVSLGENKSVCSGETVTLDAGAGHMSYEWSTGDMGQTIEISEEGSLEYWVEVTDEKGCKNRSEAVEVRVDPLPVVSLGENKSVCSGETVTLDAGAGHTSYEWSTGDMGQTIEISEEGSLEYWVEVTDEKGCKGRSEAVEVRVDPLPVVSLGENKSVCSGETVTLDAGAGHTSYEWSTGDMGQTIEISEEGSLEYWVEVTDESRCSNRSNSVTVSINPRPQVSIREQDTICKGQVVNLWAEGGELYSWSTGDNTSSIEISPAQTTEYSVIVKNQFECEDSASIIVNVKEGFDLEITGPSAVCPGDAAILSVNKDCRDIRWSVGETTAEIEVAPLEATEYSVVATNEHDCYDTAFLSLAVYQKPTAMISGPSAVCQGDSATFTATGGVKFKWNTGDTSSVLRILPSDGKFTTSGTGYLTNSYQVIVSDDNSCSDTSSAELAIYRLPDGKIIGDSLVCPGESTELSAQSSDVVDYLWSTGETIGDITFTPNKDTSVYVILTSEHNCKDTATLNIKLKNEFNVELTGDTSICPGETATLNAFGGDRYRWERSGETNATIEVEPGTTSEYTVIATNAEGCVDTASIKVNVNPVPKAKISGKTSLCPEETSELTASGGVKYEWNTGEKDSSVTASTVNNTYEVTVTNIYGCSSVASVNIENLPIPKELFVSGSDRVCKGQETTLTATGANSYSWSNGAQTSSITVFPNETTRYIVTGSNEFGCKNEVEFNVEVIKDFASIDNQVSYCSGDSVFISATNGIRYLWSTGDTTSMIRVKPGAAKDYWVIVTNEEGCKDTATAEIVASSTPYDNFDCPKDLGNINSWVSDDAEFSNEQATPDDKIGKCWSQSSENGIWFKFYAEGAVKSVTVRTGGGCGKMKGQQIILTDRYGKEIDCAEAPENYQGPLTLLMSEELQAGDYYILVDDISEHGTFKLEINHTLSNDDFENAFNIGTPASWTSKQMEFTNIGATRDGSKISCTGSKPDNDVWFKFKATARSISVKLNSGEHYGTISNPVVALYDASKEQLACNKTSGLGSVKISRGDLQPGEWYYISVSTIDAIAGSFTLSTNNNLNPGNIYYAIADGNWNSNIWAENPEATEACGHVPGINDIVYIRGHHVSVSTHVKAYSVYITLGRSTSLDVSSGVKVELKKRMYLLNK